jgi:hypothetical protein
MCGIYHRKVVDQMHPEVLRMSLRGKLREVSVAPRLAKVKGAGVVETVSAGHGLG